MSFMRISNVVPTRSIIWIMMFTCTFMCYMLRTNISIVILAMVKSKKKNFTAPIPECLAERLNSTYHGNGTLLLEKHGHSATVQSVTYDWDTKLQALILGAYFWGFVIAGIPAAAIAEKYGPRRTVGISFLVCSVLTLLAPFCASIHAHLLIASRFIIGLLSGIVYPGVHCLISKWSPPAEKGIFISATLGGSLGTVITWPLLGNIIEHTTWDIAFYTCGIITLVWTCLWMFLVSDSPTTHKWISTEEKDHIETSLAGTLSAKKRIPPYKCIALSIRAWALIIAQFGSLWGLFFLMTAGPNFLSTVLGFDLGHTGFLAALPYLARLISGFVFGNIGDFIMKKEILGRTKIRKFFTIFSHIIPGVLLIVQTSAGCNVTWAIALITLSLASNGATTLTNLSNAQDLAPNFAGSLYGIANCVGSTTGFITPLIVGYLTADHNGMHEWHIIFYIGASVYIACGIFFMIFGSGDIQPWNYEESEKIEIEIPETPTEGFENAAFDKSSEDKN